MSNNSKTAVPLLIVIWSMILGSLFIELLWLIQPAELNFLTESFFITNLSFPVFAGISASILLFLFASWENLQFFLLAAPAIVAALSLLALTGEPSICIWLSLFAMEIFWLWTVLGLWLHSTRRRLLLSGWVFISCLLMLYMYADSLFYKLTKAHIGYVHVWGLQFKSSWESISSSLEAMKEGLFLPITFIILNVVLYFFLRREAKISRCFRPVFLAVVLQAFSAWFVFDYIVQQTPLVKYLMAKYDFSDLSLPGSGFLQRLEKSNPDAEKTRLTMENFHRNGKFTWTGGDHKNILLLLLESVRSQDFDENMPKLREIARKGIYFTNHRSVSNYTKSALFGLYHSSYPFQFLENFSKLPEANYLKFLKAENYQLYRIYNRWGGKIVGSMFKDFTAIEVPKELAEESVENAKPVEWEVPTQEEHIQLISRNSEKILEKTLETLGKDGQKFIDSYLFNPHFNYYFPDEYTKFTPILPARFALYQLDPTQENLTGLMNRYKNALYYLDECLDKFFKEFYEKGFDKNTLVVIIGDHGQSLGDDGFFGHASGPHEYQFKIPCILLGAGIEPQEYTSISQHVDLIPTIGAIVGYQATDIAGKNLFVEKRNFTVEQEHSKMGRFIVRRRDFMSIYDSDYSGKPRWLISIGNKFQIDEKIFALYSEQGLPFLEKTIEDDFKMLEREGSFGKK